MSLILLEGSFQKDDIPPRFYCAIVLDPFNEERMADLAQMKLVGIEGITSSKEEAEKFFSIGRNGLLEMDGQDTVVNNQLSKVLYDNAHYLTSRNFTIFMRVFGDKEKAFAFHTFLEDVFIAVRVKNRKKVITPEQRSFLTDLTTNANHIKKISQLFWVFQGRINSVQMLAQWVVKTLTVMFPEQDIKLLFPYEDVLKALTTVALTMTSYLSAEKEWLVKNKTLTVPPMSTLRIAMGRTDSKWDNQMKEIIKTYGLMSKYNVWFGR